jgi:uncharacterized membrane protein
VKSKLEKSSRALAILLVVTGLGHFVFPQPLDAIVPPALPFEPRFWTYLSGVAELVVAGLLLVPAKVSFKNISIKRFGIWSALSLFVLVYPANIYMAIDWSSRGFIEAFPAYLRLPFQFGLFYWCWYLLKLEKVSK